MLLIRGQRFGPRALLVHRTKQYGEKRAVQQQVLVIEGKREENRGP